MRAKAFCTILFVAVISVAVFVPGVQANLDAVYTVDSFFTALNADDLDEASGQFAADAVAGYATTNQWFEGRDEIAIFLEGMHHEGRAYEIVQLSMVDDTVDLTVDIADRGRVWAWQRLTVEVQDGFIQRLEVVEIRLTLWRIFG